MQPHMEGELTLLVPTFNRHGHLRRLLGYYSSRLPGVKVLVLDSSEEAVRDANHRLVAELGGPFLHRRFPGDLPVAKKLLLGLGEVDTPYCAFCADDDLVFPEGLERALAFLRENPEFVCADGIYLNFHPVGHQVQVKLEYGSEGIDPSHPCARVFRLFQRYESLFYGVFRTADLREIFGGVCNVPSLHYQELFQAAAALLIGKSHRLPVFYAGRQHGEAAEPSRDKWQTYYWFAENRVEFLQHYAAYRRELAAFYRRRGQAPLLDEADFEQAMDLAHATFFGVGCPPKYFFGVLQRLWPDDPFRDMEDSGDISDQLKGTLRRRWEGFVDGAARVLEKAVRPAHPRSSVVRLNSEVKALGGTAWSCTLPAELRWLSGNPEFRGAYKELCAYLNTN
jgi:glycosyltransferase domain-containing protein